ncbi:MAG: hypothetical protein ABFR82_01030 [Nitrospirota bacterium]
MRSTCLPVGRENVGVIHELPLQARHGMYHPLHTVERLNIGSFEPFF